jgi:hypothetical protein
MSERILLTGSTGAVYVGESESSMRLAMTEGAIDRDLTGEDLLKAIKEANPLSKSKAPEVEAMAMV